MKILITSDWYLPTVNGVVTSLKNLREELIKQGHEVRVVTLSSSFKSYKRDDVYYIGSVSAGKIYPEARLRAKRMAKVMRHIEEWGPDVVHSQCEFSTFAFAKKVSKELDIPLVHTYHTVYEDYVHYLGPARVVGKGIVTGLSKHIAKQCDAMIVPTEKVKKLLEGYKIKTSTHVVPTGIVLDKFQKEGLEEAGKQIRKEEGYTEEDVVLAAIGRLAKEKNTIEIVKIVASMEEEVKLMMVGDGPYREILEEKCSRVQNNSRFNFVGMVEPDKVPKYYRAGDIFVCASTSETQGLTYVEALASGLPVLCRKDECLDELVVEGYNGWQYESIEEFKEKLLNYMKLSKEDKKQMSRNAMESAERYSSRSFASNVADIYTQCIENRMLQDKEEKGSKKD